MKDLGQKKFEEMGGKIDEIRLFNEPVFVADYQYIFMGVWAFKKIVEKLPQIHIDIGGDIDFLSYLSLFTKVEFRDIRPAFETAGNLSFVKDDITNLHIEDNSVKSLSCLHVAEHIGLGRYGDEINPDGFKIACSELKRVLAPGGTLYFAIPVGKMEKVVFNAHRVFLPSTVLAEFEGLNLRSCALGSSWGEFYDNCDVAYMESDDYGVGMFEFRKP